jgi:hypothetical protein
VSTEVWLPRTRRNGGISLVSVSNHAIYKVADTTFFLGMGNVLQHTFINMTQKVQSEKGYNLTCMACEKEINRDLTDIITWESISSVHKVSVQLK